MTLYELTKKYGEGKGEDMMWKTLSAVSDSIEDSMDERNKNLLLRHLYGIMSGGHYNEEYALCDVSKMYYTDDNGNKKYAPYWTKEEVKDVYDSVRRDIPSEYNFWDFYVVLNMIKSDNCPLLRKWFPSATNEELNKKLVELSVNWLKDDDNPYGAEKAWGYINK